MILKQKGTRITILKTLAIILSKYTNGDLAPLILSDHIVPKRFYDIQSEDSIIKREAMIYGVLNKGLMRCWKLVKLSFDLKGPLTLTELFLKG